MAEKVHSRSGPSAGSTTWYTSGASEVAGKGPSRSGPSGGSTTWFTSGASEVASTVPMRPSCTVNAPRRQREPCEVRSRTCEDRNKSERWVDRSVQATWAAHRTRGRLRAVITERYHAGTMQKRYQPDATVFYKRQKPVKHPTYVPIVWSTVLARVGSDCGKIARNFVGDRSRTGELRFR